MYLAKNLNKQDSSWVTRPTTSPLVNDLPSKFNHTYLLPVGWNAKVELTSSIGDSQYEMLKVKKDEYELEIGRWSTGRARCVTDNNNLKDYKIINNSDLSTGTIVRENSSQALINNSKIHLQLCSDFIKSGFIEYGTKFGGVDYYLPVNYDPKILEEMDSIVESLK